MTTKIPWPRKNNTLKRNVYNIVYNTLTTFQSEQLKYLPQAVDKSLMKTLNLLLPLLVVSCHTLSLRGPASLEMEPPELKNLAAASEQILRDVESTEFDNEECLKYLPKLERSLDGLNLTTLPKKELLADADRIAENSWLIRLALHKKLPEFSAECAYQVQSNFRQFRFIEDYLLEIDRKVEPIYYVAPAKKGEVDQTKIDFQTQPIPMKEATPFYLNRLAKDGKPLDLQTGDLFITRGLSFLSSMIARLGDRPTQFSHVVMISKDEATGKIETIESYVGVGVGIYDIDFALKNENARILWLRPKKSTEGKAAGTKMINLIRELKAKGKKIPYDYALNFKDESAMSCAEVSQVAYKNVGITIPYYPNQINGGAPVINRLGFEKGETYEPGDMEIDPQFELMGEFHDLRLSRDSRLKDAVMSAIFRWMNEENYVLSDTFKSKLAGGLIYKLRHSFAWPLLKKIPGMPDFSKEIPSNMISTVQLMEQLSTPLYWELKAKDQAFEKEHGLPMSGPEFDKVLEEFRLKDLALWQNKKTRKKAKFHKMLHPVKGSKGL